MIGGFGDEPVLYKVHAQPSHGFEALFRLDALGDDADALVLGVLDDDAEDGLSPRLDSLLGDVFVSILT